MLLGSSLAENAHCVDFRNFAYPWDTPAPAEDAQWVWMPIPARGQVRLTDGKHRFTNPEAPEVSPAVRFEFAVYGDLDPGFEAAAVVLNYTTGGTQNWDYLYVYRLDHNNPVLIGLLKSGSRAYGGLNDASIQHGLLVLDFADPEKRTGDCCSTGFIRVRYRRTPKGFVEEGSREYGEVKPMPQ